MNGMGGGGMSYHGDIKYEDDIKYEYDDSMYANVRGNLVQAGGVVMNMTTGNKMSGSMGGYVTSGLNNLVSNSGPLSSLHGLTNQPQLLPSQHPSSVIITSSYLNSMGSGGNGMSGAHGLGGMQNTGGLASGGRMMKVDNYCCLIEDGRKCLRTAGNASYNKRVQKTVFHKRLRLENDTHTQHIYICDHHKRVIQNARARQAKESDDEMNDGNSDEIPEVDLYQLQVNTLRRYKRHYKISSKQGLNKAQLAEAVTQHFKTIPVQDQEKEIVTYFIYMIKSERNKLDGNRADAPHPSVAQSSGASEYNKSERY